MIFRLNYSIHPSYVLLAMFFGVISGNAFALVFQIDQFSHILWTIVAIILLSLALLKPAIPSIIASFLAGNLLIMHRISYDLMDQLKLRHYIGKNIQLTGAIAEDPEFFADKIQLRLKNLTIDQIGYHGTAFVHLVHRSDPSQSARASPTFSTPIPSVLKRSHLVTVSGVAKEGFDSFSLALKQAKLIQVQSPKVEDPVLALRHHFTNQVKTYLPTPESELALGYLLGLKSTLPKTLLLSLQTVGLTHIIVASGANLSILISFARKFFGKISRFTALIFSLSLTLLFIFAVGFTPSMVRAGIVAVLSLFAWYYGRVWRPINLLSLAASITLFINPMYLIDLGWLLSFGAFSGILICAPILANYFYGPSQKLNLLRSALIETLSATLICLPILVYFFGSFSLLSLLANLCILPTIPLVMALTFLSGLVVALRIPLPLFGFMASLIVKYHLFIINFLGSQKSFLVEIPKNNPFVFLAYFPILAFLIWASYQNRIQVN